MHHAIKCMQGEVYINELLAHCITSVAWSNSAGIPTLFVTDSFLSWQRFLAHGTTHNTGNIKTC